MNAFRIFMTLAVVVFTVSKVHAKTKDIAGASAQGRYAASGLSLQQSARMVSGMITQSCAALHEPNDPAAGGIA